MGIPRQAIEPLRACEAQLRDAAVQSLQSQDYDSARSLMELAEHIAKLQDGTRNDSTRIEHASEFAPVGRQPPGDAGSATHGDVPSSRRSKQSKYPQFRRSADRLVKVAWSKTQSEEYEHKAPKAAIDAVVSLLQSRGRPGRAVRVDDLMPVLDPSTGEEFPAYQVYLVVAWLRQLGVLRRRGREGYEIAVKDLSPGVCEQRWHELPAD